jgi:hypothetical protein
MMLQQHILLLLLPAVNDASAAEVVCNAAEEVANDSAMLHMALLQPHWRWTGNPVGIVIPVTTMVKRQISVRVSIRKQCSNTN